MQKTIFASVILLAVLLLTQTACAQYSSTWIGARIGANIANESFDAVPDGASTGMKFGVIGGLAFEHWFDESWGIASGVLYTQDGVHQEYAQYSIARKQHGNDDFTLSYIEVPVTIKYALSSSDFRPYVFAGPSFGFLMAASETVDGSGITPVAPDLKSNLQSMNISLWFGLGLMDRVYQGPTYFFDAGYAAGLTKLFKNSPVRDFDRPIDVGSAKSSDIRVTIGAMWSI